MFLCAVVADLVGAELVQPLIDHPALPREMAAASRARAVACFDWTTVTARLEALWRGLRRTGAVLENRALRGAQAPLRGRSVKSTFFIEIERPAPPFVPPWWYG